MSKQTPVTLYDRLKLFFHYRNNVTLNYMSRGVTFKVKNLRIHLLPERNVK